MIKNSAVDPDFKMRIRIRIQAILADPDPDPIRIQVISMDRAWNSDHFTFLKFENPSTGSKVISHQSFALFVQKSKFLADSIFKNKSNIVKLAKNYDFWAKIWIHDKKSITFEPLDGFSKNNCLNPLKFGQESIQTII